MIVLLIGLKKWQCMRNGIYDPEEVLDELLLARILEVIA
jgi:predicted DNA-binding protein (UPF0278 family)